MSPIPVIVIFDIGKTNKKVFLFDRDYQIVFEKSAVFPETKDEDGFPCDDVNLLKNFILETMQELLDNASFDIKAVNFSGYGASFVHLDDQGRELTPLYNYLKPLSEEVRSRFTESYGDLNAISLATASPILGNLNSGMQLFGLKQQHPDIFAQITHSLHLPQYLSWLISGKPVSEITSIGCHTMLWNFEENDYHQWVKKEAIDLALPDIAPASECFPINVKGKKIPCGTGLHDSSSALVPYLKSFTDPFLLISTGTWNICLNPFDQTPLTAEQLQNDCLCYMQYTGRPVKASRLFAGDQHAKGASSIAQQFQLNEQFYRSVQYDEAIESDLLKNAVTSIAGKNSMFDPSGYADAKMAYHALILEIVQAQLAAAEWVMNGTPVKDVYVDGGFSKNDIFMQMLSRRMQGKRVHASEVSQASSIGAALAIHSYWNDNPPNNRIIRLVSY